jgi:hypothetical protein
MPDHGRYSFRFSFGAAEAATNESIPFRDAFYTLNVFLSRHNAHEYRWQLSRHQAHLSGVL